MYIKTKVKTLPLSDYTHVMGILNITPDSFSDGGRYTTIDLAVERALKMEAEGADIIDVGGESTRPNHEPVTVEEEIARVIPVIEALEKRLSIPISIDSYKAETAEAAIKAGASIINDIWGAKHDPNIAHVAAKYDVPIILMHNRMNKQYDSLIDDMIVDLEASIKIAKDAGVPDGNIILDPGIGFALELEDNYLVMQELERFTKHFPYPFLLATSRKSFISKVLPNEAEERDNATGATTCFGITKGVHIVRVHDVKRTVELTKMMDAMVKGLGDNGQN
ncbi:MAG TPA: dihydropteroate synthase [Pseudogracilibacillus sp.]|nr:dihydropteroate synthase [Pseudogracilibacillus sp.]